MATQVLFPKIGFSMEDGVLSEWLVPDGSIVTEGQVIYTLESEKSTQEIEAPVSGTLKILSTSGETYKVGDLLAEII